MKTIYVKQIGSSWTFCDEYGYCVHADGELAYHPDFFDKRPSGYPLYQEAAIEEKHGKLVGDGSDNPDEYDILFSDWDE